MSNAVTHPNLIAHEKALEAAGMAITLVMRVPAPLKSIADQAIRSASSVPATADCRWSLIAAAVICPGSPSLPLDGSRNCTEGRCDGISNFEFRISNSTTVHLTEIRMNQTLEVPSPLPPDSGRVGRAGGTFNS